MGRCENFKIKFEIKTILCLVESMNLVWDEFIHSSKRVGTNLIPTLILNIPPYRTQLDVISPKIIISGVQDYNPRTTLSINQMAPKFWLRF